MAITVTNEASGVQSLLESAQIINDIDNRNKILGTIGSAAIATVLIDPAAAVSVIVDSAGDAVKADNILTYLHLQIMETAADAALAQAQKAVEWEARFSDVDVEFDYDRISQMIEYYSNVIALKELVNSY